MCSSYRLTRLLVLFVALLTQGCLKSSVLVRCSLRLSQNVLVHFLVLIFIVILFSGIAILYWMLCGYVYTFEYVLCGMYGIPYKSYMYICCTRGMFCMPLLLHMRVVCAQLLDISAPPLDRHVSSVVCSHCAIPVVQTPVVCIRCPLGSATYLVTVIDWYCNTVFRHNMYIRTFGALCLGAQQSPSDLYLL